LAFFCGICVYLKQAKIACLPVSSFTDLPRVFGNIVAVGLDTGNDITPSDRFPYAFLLHTQIWLPSVVIC